FPVLLEGETSAGKTSIVCYLARITGNKIVRINNHEHTDVQEYMGSYVGDAAGRLVFREGALVRAVKDGSWVILDELNLAPTDIIEALNRLLDDNRELFVPELNVVIRAHPRFRLFATQNPAGTYGGRKRLSRALMSRFVVLKFDHLPLDELSSMVCARCGVHTSAATKMINVLSKLRLKRSVSGVFSARDG
ncbi:ATPase family protein, partial [Oesophagostomum dentatum]